MRPLPITELAGLPPYLLGVATIRGAPCPVVDLAQLLSGRSEAAIGRFVTIREQSRSVALAVTSVDHVGRLPLEAPAGALVPALTPEHLEQVRALGPEAVGVLSEARLVPPEVWARLAEAEESS